MVGALLSPRRSGRSTRDWIVDGVLFALVLAAGPLPATGWFGDDPATPARVVNVALGVLSCVALWWRRRWPVQLSILLSLATGFSPASDPAGAAAMFTVAVHRSGGMAAAVAVVNLFMAVPKMLLFAEAGEPWWLTPLLTTFGTAVVISWGMWIRARRQLVQSLAERARRAETEQQLRVEQARRGERTQIAREMHDTLAHRISLLSMHAGALEFRPDAPPADIAKAAGVIRSSAHQALSELRDVLAVLREGDLDDAPDRPQPGLDDVGDLVASARQAGTPVAYTRELEPPEDVSSAVGRNAYRIVQEALTNARKHASGRQVSLSLTEADGGVRIEVRNELSRASSAIPGAGTGLVGLAERASLAGGTLEHGVTGRGEFRLAAWLPWRSEDR